MGSHYGGYMQIEYPLWLHFYLFTYWTGNVLWII